MARVRYTTGMSITDIIHKGYNYFAMLDEKALREAVGRLGSAVNKRYRTFTDVGDESPASTALERSGGKITTRGKTVEELRDEYGRALNYLNDETSTRSRWNVVRQHTIDVMKTGRGGSKAREMGDLPSDIPEIEIDIEDYNTFWKAYGELVKTDRKYRDKEYRYEAWERLQKTLERRGNEDKSPEQIAQLVKSQLKRAYEARERSYNDRNGGTSQFIRRRDTL